MEMEPQWKLNPNENRPSVEIKPQLGVCRLIGIGIGIGSIGTFQRYRHRHRHRQKVADTLPIPVQNRIHISITIAVFRQPRSSCLIGFMNMWK